MLTPRSRRLLALGVLLSGLGLLCVWYGAFTPAPQAGIYPGNTDISETPERYIGDRVVVHGTVVSTSPLRIRLDTPSAPVVVITDLDRRVTVNQDLSVLGVLTAERTVDASRSLTVSKQNVWYMYLVSALAGLWVLARLLRGWTVDWQRLELTPAGHSREET